jgi:hypothetical protein
MDVSTVPTIDNTRLRLGKRQVGRWVRKWPFLSVPKLGDTWIRIGMWVEVYRWQGVIRVRV